MAYFLPCTDDPGVTFDNNIPPLEYDSHLFFDLNLGFLTMELSKKDH
jgi:hypothetical protein